MRARGFTLIELLVALLVFAIIAAAAYSSVAQLATVQAAVGAQQQRLRALQTAIGTLERDLRDALARTSRDGQGRVEPALIGTRGGVRLSRGGRANPMSAQRANFERVSWSWQDRELVRLALPHLDASQFDPRDARPFIDEVDRIEFSYLDAQGRWLDTWPAPNAGAIGQARLPRAVAFVMTLSDYGSIRRVVALTEFSGTALRPETGP